MLSVFATVSSCRKQCVHVTGMTERQSEVRLCVDGDFRSDVKLVHLMQICSDA